MKNIYRYFILFLLIQVPVLLNSQTKFHWADSKIKLENYGYWARCLAVGIRSEDSVLSRVLHQTDTLHYSSWNEIKVLPAEVISNTKRCIQPIPLPEISENIPLGMQVAYLLANDEEKAGEVVKRKLAGFEAGNYLSKATAIDTAIFNYVNATRARYKPAIELYNSLLELREKIPSLILVRSLTHILNAASVSMDMDTLKLLDARAVELAKLISAEDWEDRPGFELSARYSVLITQLELDTLVKNLIINTSLYSKTIDDIFQARIGRVNRAADAFPLKLGKAMPSIKGDYWFNADSSVSYPRSGRVTVVFPVGETSVGPYTASIRRLANKFPEVDFILVAHTKGYFLDIEPPTPREEAILLDSMYRQFFKLPVKVAITNTNFWRVPGRDRRRVDDKTENQENGFTETGMLIDKSGHLVYNAGTSGQYEKIWEQLIPAALKQGTDSPK